MCLIVLSANVFNYLFSSFHVGLESLYVKKPLLISLKIVIYRKFGKKRQRLVRAPCSSVTGTYQRASKRSHFKDIFFCFSQEQI